MQMNDTLKNFLVGLRANPIAMAAGAALARLLPAAHYIGDNTMLVRTVFGHRLFVDVLDESVGRALVMDGFWEKNITRAFLKLVTPGCTVLEVGANLGYFTTLAGSRVGRHGRVYAFEANPHVARLLRRSIDANGIAPWCTVIEQAVCDRVGQVTFYSRPTELGMSGLLAPGGEQGDAALRVMAIDVPCTTLDAYFGAQIPRIDVMKMDAEGAEPLVLKGMQALLKANPGMAIVMEFNRALIQEATGDAQAFLEDLQRMGFRFRMITRFGGTRQVRIDELMDAHHCDVVLSKN